MADPAQAANLARFFKTGPGQYGAGDKFLGLKVPQTRNMIKDYCHLPLTEVEKLIISPFHEIRLAALFILIKQFENRNATETERRNIFQFYLKYLKAGYINNWDLVDLSTPQIVGAYLIDKPRNILQRLARSHNLWERRVAILSTFTFIRHDDFVDIFTLTEKLLTDKHDLIHKALGWMMREVGKRSYRAEEDFLKKYYKKMPRTMLRYAIEKFPEHQRQNYFKNLV